MPPFVSSLAPPCFQFKLLASLYTPTLHSQTSPETTMQAGSWLHFTLMNLHWAFSLAKHPSYHVSHSGSRPPRPLPPGCRHYALGLRMEVLGPSTLSSSPCSTTYLLWDRSQGTKALWDTASHLFLRSLCQVIHIKTLEQRLAQSKPPTNVSNYSSFKTFWHSILSADDPRRFTDPPASTPTLSFFLLKRRRCTLFC